MTANHEESTSTTGIDGGVTTSKNSTNENLVDHPLNSSTRTTTESSSMALESNILDFLCRITEIQFKSQQIDDPELSFNEKRSIAKEILEKNHGTFLLRFGKYLQSEHLNYFEITNDNNKNFEVIFLVKNLRKNLEHKHKNIKNRRYAAMQAMIKENKYFSEKEMMQREPYLYEQLVGQYLTDSEKRIRDSSEFDDEQLEVENTPFSKILLDNIDKERMDELRRRQEREERCADDGSTYDDDDEGIHAEDSQYCANRNLLGGNSSSNSEDNLYPKIPAEFRKQWGNFDSESESQQDKALLTADCSNNDMQTMGGYNQKKKQPQKQKYITGGEREILRQEFLGIMYTKFLEGDDKDFDYSQVDNNPDLDDLKQIQQDDEDKYFNESDDDDDPGDRLERDDQIMGRMDDEDMDSDDELDTYMKNLKKHPSLQNK